MTKYNKIRIILLAILVTVLIATLLVACDKTPQPSPNPDPNPAPTPTPEPNPTPEPSNKNITGVTFSNLAVTYDGEEHELTVSGTIPEGVSVSYDNNKGTNAGTYNATATLSGEGYNTLTLSAKLTINKATIEGVSLSSVTVEYDGQPHSIDVVGNVPAGVTVTYLYNGIEDTSATDVGEYEVVAVLSGDNYVTLRLTAGLKIISTEEMLYSAFFNGYAYFQNSLDGNKLYSVTSNGTIAKVSNDVSTYFTSNSTSLYFYSGSLFSQTIKSLTTGSPITVFNSGRSTYLACDNDGNVYYAKANLVDVKGENGIYKVNINDGDPTPVRLTTDKADYIAYYGGYIYYSNKSDGSRLYRIAVTANNGNGVKLHDNKVSDILVEDGDVFFTEHTLTGSSIHKYHISSGKTTKLCIDNGAYLTKVGEYIYYVNKDLLTSNIFGKGIYRVSVVGETLGEKVLATEDNDGYYSLASDGTNIYYYRLNDKHFYRYNPTTQIETDLMRNFVPTEETPNFSSYPYAHLTTYKGEIYYTNVLDGNSLYKYNPQTKGNFKVLTDSIANVSFYGNYMYYSTYIFTNYALWRLDLTNAEAEPEKISPHRYEHLIFEGNYIYALRVQPPIIVGQENTNRIVRLDLDGQNETELYKKKNVHITKLFLLDGQFHFTINPAVGYKYIYTHDLNGELEEATDTGIRSDNFVIYDSRYYYFDQGNGLTGKGFKSCKLDGTDGKTLASDVDITEIYQYGGVVYYTSTNSKNTGIYAYNVISGTTAKLTDKVGHGFVVTDGQLYFINVSLTYTTDYPHEGDGDGHLYSINLSNNVLTKLA